jgi:FkbM family methyltransferase
MGLKSFTRWLVLLPLLYSASLSPALGKDLLTTEKKLYSQFNEELIIRDFFQDRRNGYFVDVGCAWPIKDSTTYYLEKHLNWSGIAVDARAALARLWKEKRPNGRFFNYLITDHAGTNDPFYLAGGLSSTQKERTFMDRTIKGEETNVPTTTMNKLLDDNKVSHIDLLSMDIEEGEPAALSAFDIDRFKPQLVCIEAGPTTRDKILTYFNVHGYRRIEKYLKADHVNWYFKPEEAPASSRVP